MRIQSNMFPEVRGDVRVTISHQDHPQRETGHAFRTYDIRIIVGKDEHEVTVYCPPGAALTVDGEEWTP